MQAKVLGVLAGQDIYDASLLAWASSADLLVAADGAAHRLIELGLRPVVVGDLDSFDPSAPSAQGLPIHHDPDQSTTDCDKLLRWVGDQGHEEIVLICVEGDRLDHLLSSLFSALRSSLRASIILRTGRAWVLRSGDSISVPSTVGCDVSLLPLLPCSGVELSGVEWPLAGADLHPSGLLSISNRSLTSEVSARVGEGGALLVVSSEHSGAPDW